MKIKILGSGTMVMSKKRNPSAYLIKIKNEQILLDCGHGLMRRLLELGIDWLKINYIGISHTHTDHLAGLMPIIHAQFVKYVFDKSRKRRVPLKIFAPQGFRKQFIVLRKIMWPEVEEWPHVPVEIKECQKSKFKIKDFILEINTIKHAKYFKKALSFKIREGRKTFVYSGDTGPEIDKGSFIKFARRANLLVIDGSRPPAWEKGGHLRPFEAGEIAEKAGVKHLVLTHLTDLNTFYELISDCRRTYSGKITVAQDLMEFKL